MIVVASVSCIYGIGSKEEYGETVLRLKVGETYGREDILRRLIDMQFTRNDIALGRGTFRVRGDVLEIQPADEEVFTRVEFFGDEIEKIKVINPITGEVMLSRTDVTVYPASHFVTSADKMERALEDIERELEDRVALFQSRRMLLEAQRIEQRTRFDMEMMRELGYCNGIENYSRILDGRHAGQHSAYSGGVFSTKISFCLSTSRIRQFRSSTLCSPATAPASRPWSNMASDFPPRSTTGR